MSRKEIESGAIALCAFIAITIIGIVFFEFVPKEVRFGVAFLVSIPLGSFLRQPEKGLWKPFFMGLTGAVGTAIGVQFV